MNKMTANQRLNLYGYMIMENLDFKKDDKFILMDPDDGQIMLLVANIIQTEDGEKAVCMKYYGGK